MVEIQVPGTPSRWAVEQVNGGLVGTREPVLVPSPGRIEGTSDIYVFTFVAVR